jgi:DcaP outer membrane protein
VKTSTPTGFGDLKTIFEFELFGTGVDAGQTTFRLRHAYGELGHFGAGQTWSPFMDIDMFPNSLEYWGPSGMVFFRNIQARWAPIQNDKLRLIFAVERPGASADGGVYSDRVELQNVKPKFDLPDFSWQVRFMREWGHVQVAGIFRKISWVNTVPNPQFDIGRDVLGWGVNVTSNVNITKKDVGRFAFVYGDGIQNYMNDAPIDVGVKNTPSNPLRPIEGVPLPILGLVSFIDHNWNSHFSSSIGYSLVDISNSSGETPSDYHQGHYALTNLLYHPVPPVTVGGEFQYGRRVNFSDGFNVNDYRLQFSFKYDWKKGFAF